MAQGKGFTPSGPVNLKRLAQYLELSQTTVSLVLNHSPSAKSIPLETRNRVMEAAKRLQYRPNYFARSLRQSRSMSVGVLAPDLSEGYFTRVMSGVVEELTAARYFYFTACHDWKRELIEQYPRMLVERRGWFSAPQYPGGAHCRASAGGGHLRAQRRPQRHQHRPRSPSGRSAGPRPTFISRPPPHRLHARPARHPRFGVPLGGHPPGCRGDAISRSTPRSWFASTPPAGQ